MVFWGKKIRLISIGEDMGNGTLTHCKWEHNVGTTTSGNNLAISNAITYGSAISF